MARRRWWVEGFHGGVWLVVKSGGGAEVDASPDVDILRPEAAASRMDEWFPERWGNTRAEATLAELAAALGEELLWHSDASEAARRKRLVQRAIWDGRLVALRVRVPAPAGGEGEQEEEARPAERASREDKTWIESAWCPRSPRR